MKKKFFLIYNDTFVKKFDTMEELDKYLVELKEIYGNDDGFDYTTVVWIEEE